MRKRIVTFFAVVALSLVSAIPALAAPPADSPAVTCGPFVGQSYGEVHKGLATSGLTGSAHIPGNHKGAAGLCLGIVDF